MAQSADLESWWNNVARVNNHTGHDKMLEETADQPTRADRTMEEILHDSAIRENNDQGTRGQTLSGRASVGRDSWSIVLRTCF